MIFIGQHENQNILINETQIELIDRFAKNEIKDILWEYTNKYDKRKEILNLLDKDIKDEMYTKRQLDLLKFQIEEIEEAKLKIGEDEEIENKFKLLNNSEKIIDVLKLSKETLSDDLLKNLSLLISQLESISSLNEKYFKYLEILKSAFYELEELNYDINDDLDNIDIDVKEIISIENRLDKINSLKRKYGNTIEDINKYLEEIKQEYKSLENFEEDKEKLEEELKQIESDMEILADKIFNIRFKYSKEISKKVTEELYDLEMKTAKFLIEVKKSNDFNKYGKNELKFLIMTNKGSDYLPIEKIASGGEMSRIMLSIKTVLSKEDETPILIFDEIDTGISGITGEVVGIKLKHIAKNHQVLCVTHLATLASKGDVNYYIYKTEEEGIIKTKIKKLNEKEVIEELARISSGKLTKEALLYAKELRNRK